jgi:hypothetical protein
MQSHGHIKPGSIGAAFLSDLSAVFLVPFQPGRFAGVTANAVRKRLLCENSFKGNEKQKNQKVMLDAH